MSQLQNAARLRYFTITVDGIQHEVVVEELVPRDTSTPSAPPAVSAGAVTPSDLGSGGGDSNNPLAAGGWVLAPMPGTVTELSVNVGDTVRSGDTLLLLTAMKLENEIVAPAAGVVKHIRVAVGDNVNSDDQLVQLEA